MNSTATLDDCFLTFHALAGDAPSGGLPNQTYPVLLQVRPVILDDGTPGVVVTATCRGSVPLGLTCEDATALGEWLQALVTPKGRARASRSVRVMGPDWAVPIIPRVGVRMVADRAVLDAGPAYLLEDETARLLAAALMTSAAWALATADAT